MKDFRWFGSGELPKYPALGSLDSALMSAWLRNKPSGLQRVAYNVTVGKGRPADSKSIGYLQEDWKFVTSLRIDAFCEYTNKYEIIELKPDAGANSIGQILCYNILMKEEFIPYKPIYMKIVTDSMHPDVLKCCKLLNILVDILPPLSYSG